MLHSIGGNYVKRNETVAKSREVNLKEKLAYEHTLLPYLLAHVDGSLRKTPKCNLPHMLEAEGTVSDTLPSSTEATAWTVDGMAVVQKSKPTVQSNFGDCRVRF